MNRDTYEQLDRMEEKLDYILMGLKHLLKDEIEELEDLEENDSEEEISQPEEEDEDTYKQK